MNFSNQVVWVTGASRGIGQAIAESFAKKSAIVIGTATTQQGADQINAYLGNQGKGVVLNVRDAEQCKAIFDQITMEHGAPQILVNNAGITRDNLFLRMKTEEWDEVIDIHLNALFRLCKLVIKPMIKNHYGRIINISSVVGSTGNPGQINYAAAKAGIIGFSKALALEVATRNITVNVIAPGYIQTTLTDNLTENQQQILLEKIPMKRIGTAAEIANAVLFLAHRNAAYITGQTLHVNGGLYCGN